MKSFQRWWRLLPAAIGLPLLTGACGGPLATTAVSYGGDGVSLVETNKTATDHLLSMVSKRDCAMWRMFRNQHVCRERDGDHDPYDVSYQEPFRQAGEGGVEYSPPAHAAADAPPASWDAKAYDRPGADASPPAPMTATSSSIPAPVTKTDTPATPPVVASPPPARKAAVKHVSAKRKRLKKKHAPGRAATGL
ncbi:MAG: hypothetical protein J0H44_04340 [Alphaproteobacteria bacterium]|nr:hypothetical protein [Alphaproteobacteria bacterium]